MQHGGEYIQNLSSLSPFPFVETVRYSAGPL
jgi:hypothetical protein